MKFLCDQMLVRLGRWLRAAGYDTVIVEKACDDRTILEQALREGRLLLTRDRHFMEMATPQPLVVWLKGNILAECIQELSQKVPINWLHKPFSRCLVCNHELILADDSALQLVSEDIRGEPYTFWFCEQCQKVYWDGSHTNRMLRQMEKWQHHSQL
ncbi:MAG: Mut7-C RNAse domain-containing protein [Parachlamydia sp.]|nr:Mut7-C RNAse domain-containing protein [Parachlamydia sp.]